MHTCRTRFAFLLVSLALNGVLESQGSKRAASAENRSMTSVVVPVPTPANFDTWQAHIAPTDTELRWERIPWLASFGAGLAEAGRRDKPLLFWGMNGHPLGCT